MRLPRGARRALSPFDSTQGQGNFLPPPLVRAGVVKNARDSGSILLVNGGPMRKLIHKLMMTITLAPLGGCLPAYKIPTPPITEPPSFTLVDKRTDVEKLGSNSSLITSCEYAITQLAESDIVPPRLEILKSRLQSEQGLQERLKGKTIEINSFKIIRNSQMSYRKSIGDKYPGVLSQSLVYGCIAGPEIAGSYLAEENPKHLPSFTVILNASIAKQKYSIRYFETANNRTETLARTEEHQRPRRLNNELAQLVSEP